MYLQPRSPILLEYNLSSIRLVHFASWKCINAFGFSSFALTKEDFIKEGNVVQLGYPPLRIDLLTNIDGVTFDDCFPNRKIVQIDELTVNFIGYQDLLKNKKASGRLRDLDDLDNLQ